MVVNVSLGLQLPPSGPSGSGCLSPEGDGLQPANSVSSFVLCVVLEVSYVRAFHVVVIPQSGLLAQVSLLWLHSGHSGPPSLASGGCRHLCCFSTGGVTVGLIICGFLIIYLFSLPVLLPSVLPRLATDSAARVFPGVWKLLSF